MPSTAAQTTLSGPVTSTATAISMLLKSQRRNSAYHPPTSFNRSLGQAAISCLSVPTTATSYGSPMFSTISGGGGSSGGAGSIGINGRPPMAPAPSHLSPPPPSRSPTAGGAAAFMLASTTESSGTLSATNRDRGLLELLPTQCQVAEQLLDSFAEPGAAFIERRRVIELIIDLMGCADGGVAKFEASRSMQHTPAVSHSHHPGAMASSMPAMPELRLNIPTLQRQDSAMSAQCPPPQTTRTERAEISVEFFDGTFTLNQYVLLQSIGHGAQGEVFLSVDTNKNEMRAVKAIPRPTRNRHFADDKEGLAKDQPRSPLELARANRAAQHEREIEVMKRCRHRNIVSLYEVIDDPSSDKLYLVMQYIEHGSLVTLQPDGTASQVVKPELLAQYTRQLCAGLQYLHSHGIVHRDIKPDNILLGADDTVYLSDFGVSDVFEASAHVSPITGTRGTSAFLSPELVDPATTSAVDGRAVDVWALGVTVYVMLYGKLPFERNGSMFDFWRMVLEVDVALPPVDPANPAADSAWRTLLQAMLHKSPAKRCTAEQARVYAKAIEEAYNLGSPNFSGVHSFELFPPSAFELPLDLASIVVPPRNLMMPADDMSSARSSRDASFNSRTMLPQEKSASAHPMGSISSALASAREHLHDEQTADSLATARPRSPCY